MPSNDWWRFPGIDVTTSLVEESSLFKVLNSKGTYKQTLCNNKEMERGVLAAIFPTDQWPWFGNQLLHVTKRSQNDINIMFFFLSSLFLCLNSKSIIINQIYSKSVPKACCDRRTAFKQTKKVFMLLTPNQLPEWSWSVCLYKDRNVTFHLPYEYIQTNGN